MPLLLSALSVLVAGVAQELNRTTCACLQVIELPIKHPELFDSLGIAQPKARDECCFSC